MKQKPYSIHFVCRGNTYRSRLAAAYMATIADERYAVSSSGINTTRATIKTSEAYTQAVAKKHHLTYQINTPKTQTTDALLVAADVIVFMNRDVYEEATRRFHFDARKALVWNIADLSDELRARYDMHKDVNVVMDTAEHTLHKIRLNCGKLYTYLTRGSWVDVVDVGNKSVGLRLPVSWITDRGFWHRGVHVVAQTSDGKFVVGKRAKSMIFAPGMLEITLGGAVDTGEHPLQAARRETHEELGLLLPEKHFRPLFIYRQVGYHPHYHKQTRVHLYVYAVKLPLHSDRLRPQPGEVDEIRLLTKRQLKHLLHTHRAEHFGRLKWGYQLYNKAVAYSTLPL